MAYDKSLVEKAAADTGVPASLLERVIAAESSGNPRAVSYKGPQYGEGLMQLASATADDLGVTDRFDPAQNIEGGARYLKALLDRFGGDQDRALQAYVGAKTPEKAAAYIQKVTGKMPDSAKAPTDAVDIDALTRAAQATGVADQAQLGEARKKAQAADQDYLKRLDEADKKVASYADDIAKLDAQVPKAPDETKLPGYQPPAQKNPLQALAAVMPIMLMTGSRMGRNANLALMKSMSGLLNGVSEGNEETRKQYQEDFKAKIDAAVTQAKLDHDRYMDVLEGLREQKGDVQSKIEMLAIETGNENMRYAAQTADWGRVADFAKINAQSLSTLLQVGHLAHQSEQDALRAKVEDQRFAVEQERLDKEDRRLEMTDRKEEDSIQKQLVAKGTPGEAYRAIKMSETKLDDAIRDPKRYLNIAGPTVIADTFTRAFNGGNAIRGFQAKMLTTNRSVKNTLEGALQKAQTGGEYTPEEIKQMAEAVKRVAPDLKEAFRDEAKNAIEENSDLDNVGRIIPYDLHDDVADLLPGGGGGKPAVEALPMPKRKQDAVKGKLYDVPGHGPMKWNGTAFEEPDNG